MRCCFGAALFRRAVALNSHVATSQITLLCPHKVSAVEPIGFARCVIPLSGFCFLAHVVLSVLSEHVVSRRLLCISSAVI